MVMKTTWNIKNCYLKSIVEYLPLKVWHIWCSCLFPLSHFQAYKGSSQKTTVTDCLQWFLKYTDMKHRDYKSML